MNKVLPLKTISLLVPGMGMSPSTRSSFRALLALAGFTACLAAQAAVIPKADDNSALNLGASWVGGTAPGTGDIALWDSTVINNLTDDPLGAGLSWSGIQIANPAGPIAIPADGNNLTNGAAGINMWQATQSLTLNNNLAINAPQYWQVGNGQTLSLQGALTNRSTGSAILFSFDTNASSQVILNPSAAGTVAASSSGTLLLQGTIGDGTGAGVAFGTVNDVDFAALNANNQIVPGSTISGLYTANPTGATPTAGSLSGVYDFTSTNSVGARIASTYYIDAMRFNTPQPNAASAVTYAYNGVGSWNVYFKSGSVTDINAILLTTNLGNSYVVFTSGGSMRIADSPNEFLVFQNNPASSLVWQSPITQRAANAIVSKLGVGTMEYQVACSYSGGTLLWGGTLLLDGAGTAGSGPITVHSGANFEGQSFTTNFAPVVVNNGGTNSVLLAIPNGQFVNNTNLTFNAGNTSLQFIYSNTIVPSATVAALLITNGTLTASNTVNVNVLCPNLAIGQFPLIKYTTLITNTTSSVFPFNLNGIQPHVTAYLSNNVANKSIDLVVLGNNQPLHWAAGSGPWDVGQTSSWLDAAANADTFLQGYGIGDNVVLDDTASGSSPIVVTLNSNVIPGSVTVNNSAKNYTISGSGSIGGSPLGETGNLTKTGTGELVLATTNAFSGSANLNGGIVNFSTLNSLGLGAINFGGGTLQYNGNMDDISVRTVTLAAGGATIDTAGQTVSFAHPIGNSGAGGLTKTGNGTLTLSGTNNYTGLTVVNQGTLALGITPFIVNTLISSSPAIIVNSGAILDTATSGVGLTLASGQILAGVGTVKGEVLAVTGSTITPATNGVLGNLSLANDLGVNGGNLAMDVSTNGTDLIAVTGNLGLTNGTLQVNVIGALTNGIYPLITYGGSLLSGAGSSANLTVIGFSSVNQLATLSDAKAGEIDLVIAAGAHDPLVWSGTGTTWDFASTLDWLNGSTSWAFTNGDSVTFNDVGGASPTVSLEGTVLPSVVVVSNNAETYDFQDGTGVGAGRISGSTSFVKDGTGTMINETANGYYGSTLIKHGVLQIGNGNGGDIGSGSITNNASLVFAQGDGNPHTVMGPISGTGLLTDQGSSPVVLANNNTYTGGTWIQTGTLQIGTGGTTGSLGTGPVTNYSSLIIDRSGTMTLSNTLTGSGSVAFLGTATVTYGSTAASNSCAGNTYISNGIVKLATSTAIYSDGSAGDWLILDGSPTVAGRLDLNGHNVAVNAIAGVNSTTNGLIVNNGGTTTNTLAIVGSATTTYSGTIADNTGSGGKIALLVDGGASQTFYVGTQAGNSFSGGTIISNSTVYFTTTATLLSPNCLGSGTVTLYNGAIYLPGYGADPGAVYNDLPNTLIVPTNFTGTIYGPYRGTYSGNVTGSGTVTYINDYVRGTISGNWSAFTGQIIFGNSASGANMGINTTAGFGHVYCTNTAQTAGGVAMYNVVAGTPTIPIGELADDGTTTIEAATSGGGGGVAANFAVGSLNTSTNFGGSIIDAVGIIKVGTGSWTLTGSTLTYSGLTTVSNGVLVLGTNATLPNTTPITVVSPGILDVSEVSAGLGVGGGAAAQTLQGNGKVNGSVAFGSLGMLSPGTTNTIGILTITNDVNLTQSGTNLFKLNRTNSPSTSDGIVAETIEAGGILVVTNIGPDLHTGDKFQLFSMPVTGSFSSITLPVTTADGSITYVWTTNLAVDGSMVVSLGVPNVATNPTNLLFHINGNQLMLTWPADHLGWYLQAQTNTLAQGLGTNWVDIAGSSSVNTETITVSPNSPAVFYRMSLNP